MESKTLNRSLTVLLTAFLLVGAAGTGFQGAAIGAEEGGEQVIRLKVTGMTCGLCEYSVEKALKRVESVDRAEADHDAGTATVYPVKGSSVDTAELIRSIEKLGYKAELIN